VRAILILLIIASCNKVEIEPSIIHSPSYYKTCDGVNYFVKETFSYNVKSNCFRIRDEIKANFPYNAIFHFEGNVYNLDEIVYCRH